MNRNQNSTIQYTIKLEGFTYHTRKGLLRKGSTISKSVHPLLEVESLKNKLLKKHALIDQGTFYECKRDIKTGVLMAYNLHSGKLERDIPNTTVHINGAKGEDEQIKDALRHTSFYSADNLFRINIDRDAFKLNKVMHIEYNDSFFKGKGDGSLSEVERFVIKVLKAVKEVDEYRRGNPEEQECDIVDEISGRQIEIVSYLDEKIPPKFRHSSKDTKVQSLVFEYCNFGTNNISEGVIKKFRVKNYTDKYEKELAIYMLGNGAEARNKIKALEQEVRSIIWAGKLKNDYKKLHIIIHDPLESGTIYYFSNSRQEILEDSIICNTAPIIAREIDVDDIENEDYYYISKECIFNPEYKSGALMSGADLKLYKIV